MSQKFAAYDASGAITGFYDSDASPVPQGVQAIAITDAEWMAALMTPGYTVASGALTPPPAPTSAQLLAAAQTAQIATLTSACQAAILGGFTSSALGAPHTYPMTIKDQVNLSGSVTASLMPGLPTGWTTPFWVADASGNWSMAQHTATQIQQAGADGKAWVVTCQEKLVTLTAQVIAATTVAAVQAIVWG